MGKPRGGEAPFAADGQAEAKAILTRRALIFTDAPIFKNFSRIVPQVAAANCVWARPIRRSAHKRT